MKPYKLRSTALYANPPRVSSSTLEAALFFGLRKQHFADRQIRCESQVDIYPSQVCLITGPSGSGKTQLLKAFYRSAGDLGYKTGENPPDYCRPLIDQLDGTVLARIKSLYACGIREAYSMFNTPAQLSRGERFRFELCKAVQSGKKLIFCDEFCSCLDDLSTASVCRHIQKLAQTAGYSFVVSTPNREIVKALKPEIVIYTNTQPQPITLYRTKPT